MSMISAGNITKKPSTIARSAEEIIVLGVAEGVSDISVSIGLFE